MDETTVEDVIVYLCKQFVLVDNKIVARPRQACIGPMHACLGLATITYMQL